MSSFLSPTKMGLSSKRPYQRTSLFQSATSSVAHTYAVGVDGGDLASLAAAIAKSVKESDKKITVAELSEYLSATNESDKEIESRMRYEFKGISIWLELDDGEGQHLQDVIDMFQDLGGEPRFPVHATVLYNVDPSLLHNGEEGYLRGKLEDVVSRLPSKVILLKPQRLLYFPYPREADNGRGFGCLMPFFQMSLRPELVHLFETTKNSFPPDERHGTGVGIRRCKSTGDLELKDVEERRAETPMVAVPLRKKGRSGSFHSLQGGKAYTPHVSIAYLDMSRTDIMNEKVCENLVEQRPEVMKGVRARYLSAWWTEGQVKDWKRICKVPLY